jgi:hypothetical protein
LALRIPSTVGVKVTFTAQEAPAASDPVQESLLNEKSPGFAPVRWTLVNVADATPIFVTAIEVGVLDDPTFTTGKVTALGWVASTTLAALPVKGRICGDPVASSATFSEAEKEPAAAGVNVNAIWHVPSAGRLGEQLFDAMPKSLAFVPVIVKPLNVTVAFPVLVRVTVRALLVLSTTVSGKASVDGLKEIPSDGGWRFVSAAEAAPRVADSIRRFKSRRAVILFLSGVCIASPVPAKTGSE